MDRPIVYSGAIPRSTDYLTGEQAAMVALGALAQSVFGTSTVVSGLTVVPTSPASMVVNVGPGAITSLQDLEASAYGSLSADTSDSIVKMGVNSVGVTPLTLTAPTTSGQSINYLIEATFVETDTGSTVLPYYNAASPSTPYAGPANAGTSQNTLRTQRVSLQAKAGTAATTGTQTTPAVDSGYVPLAIVTVAYGATTVVSGNITVHPSAPYPQFPLQTLRPGYASKVQFTTSGTWTVPEGVTQAYVEVWAGGGGSGATYGSTSGSQGGGGGEYVDDVVTGLTPGAAITVTVGAGGTAGVSSASPTNGGNGGNSSFGSLVAIGGTGGLAANGGIAPGVATGGTGGTGGSANATRVPGGSSWASFEISGAVITGAGGAPFKGIMAHQGANGVSSAGIIGQFPGGGATGSCNQANGQSGAAGLVVIRW